jgi:type VI secretion system secreted protein VgrG
MPYSQQERLISIDTPLGKDVLLLQGFSGVESLSRPFKFTLTLLSEESSIAFSSLVGKRVKITVKGPRGERFINGYISRFSQAGADRRFIYYQAEVVPWLWFLTRNADCRIFQKKSPVEIIKQVFQDRGFTEFSDRTQGSFPIREYCVQYRETDFNFVSRLMEQYGIFYFFEHDENSHTLVLADSSSVHQPCPNQSSANWYESAGPGGLPEEEDVITAWRLEQELRPGKYALNDYNFETPGTSLLNSVQTKTELGGNTKYEIFDYPGLFPDTSQGDQMVKLRMEEEESPVTTAVGRSTCRSFIPGFRFTFQNHYRPDMNGSYVLSEVQHSVSLADSYVSGDASLVNYSNQFTCIPADCAFRPLRVTPQPIVQGPQTAVVVGPSGEEIYVDNYGRVKVQFHWDREGKNDENSSCWIRVSSPWAGKNWGAINNPRIGQEVIVDFLEGDPDRPIITGRVYNADHMPPYVLPDNQTRSTLKSRSSKQGDPDNYNEIRLEDLKGQEQLFIRAEKDFDHRVKNDTREYVGNKRSLIVKGDKLESISGTNHSQIQMDHRQKVGANFSLDVGANRDEKVGSNYALESGAVVHIKGGMSVVIEAGVELTIQASGSFINISPAGVAIQGTMVMINSGGAAGSAADANPTAPDQPDEADDGSKGTKLN